MLKSSSGFSSVDEAYEDKLTISASSISYEYKPNPQSRLESNKYMKWSHKTNSSVFAELFERIAKMTPNFFKNQQLYFADDFAPIIITVIYEDKHRKTVTYYDLDPLFDEYFHLIKEMVPSCEYIPAVLLIEEDYSENE